MHTWTCTSLLRTVRVPSLPLQGLFASGTSLRLAVLQVLLSTLLAVLAAVLPVLPHYWLGGVLLCCHIIGCVGGVLLCCCPHYWLCWRRVAVLPCVEIGLAEHFFSFRTYLYLRLYTTLVSLVHANTPSSNAIHLFSST